MLGTIMMKTPFSCLLGIVAVLALSGPARPSYAHPQQTHRPTPAPAPTPAAAPVPPHNPAPAPATAKHTITVHFDYSFDRTPPCPQPKDKPCVERFVVYDISAGPLPSRRAQLFTIPVPRNAKGAMRGITGKSPPLPFERGQHWIGISAQMSDNKTESFPSKSAVWVTIP